MTIDPVKNSEYRIRLGVTTRPITLTTGERVCFAKEAIDKAAADVESGFLPLKYEHLSYLPPLGRVHRTEIVEDSDGEFELVFYARDLDHVSTRDAKLSKSDLLPTYAGGPIEGVQVSAPPSRNFQVEDWNSLKEESPLPFQEREAWSSLPPLEWLIYIPVTWGAVKFAGSFLEHLGSNVADSLTEWVKRNSLKARQSRRTALFTITFKTQAGVEISGYLPLDAHTQENIDQLRAALDNVGPLAEFSGAISESDNDKPGILRSAAFFYVDGEWNLGWWATNEKVAITPWYGTYSPDPRMFLEAPISTAEPEEVEAMPLPTDPRFTAPRTDVDKP